MPKLTDNERETLQRMSDPLAALKACEPWLDDPTVLPIAAMHASQCGQYRQAMIWLEQAMTDRPSSTVLSMMGNVTLRMKDALKAEQYYQQALTLDPHHATTHSNLGRLLYLKQHYAEAMMHFTIALEQVPTMSGARYNLALCHHAQNDLKRCIQEAKRLVKEDAHHFEGHHLLAQCLHRQNAFNDALQHYQYCIKVRPSCLLHHQLACLFWAMDQADDAIAEAYKALAFDPNHLETHHNLGRYFSFKQQHEAALKHDLQALTLHATVETRYNVGAAYYHLGRYQDAIEHFERVLAQDPTHRATLINLGACHLGQGHKGAAIEHYQKALALDPQAEDIDYLLKALTQTQHDYAHAPHPYIKNLFDGYADHFDEHLEKQLAYRIPEAFLATIQPYLAPKSHSILDLGFGTGLCGPRFSPWASTMTGVDLSEKMLAQARRKGCYQTLICADVLSYTPNQSFDLILLADVLPYVGDPKPWLDYIAKHLNPDGYALISIERSEITPYALTPHARFAHHPDACIAAIHDAGLVVKERMSLTSRLQESRPVPGLVYALQKG